MLLPSVELAFRATMTTKIRQLDIPNFSLRSQAQYNRPGPWSLLKHKAIDLKTNTVKWYLKIPQSACTLTAMLAERILEDRVTLKHFHIFLFHIAFFLFFYD